MLVYFGYMADFEMPFALVGDKDRFEGIGAIFGKRAPDCRIQMVLLCDRFGG